MFDAFNFLTKKSKGSWQNNNDGVYWVKNLLQMFDAFNFLTKKFSSKFGKK